MEKENCSLSAEMFFSMVRRTDQRTAFYNFKSFGFTYLFKFLELVWMDVFCYRIVLGCWLQLLSDGQYLATVL